MQHVKHTALHAFNSVTNYLNRMRGSAVDFTGCMIIEFLDHK